MGCMTQDGIRLARERPNPMHYYNEIDKTAVAWLRNLIGAGLLPEGDVDERSIRDVQASDLKG